MMHQKTAFQQQRCTQKDDDLNNNNHLTLRFSRLLSKVAAITASVSTILQNNDGKTITLSSIEKLEKETDHHMNVDNLRIAWQVVIVIVCSLKESLLIQVYEFKPNRTTYLMPLVVFLVRLSRVQLPNLHQ